MKIPRRPPSFKHVFNNMKVDRVTAIFDAVPEPTHEGKYLHWDEIRQRATPADLSTEEWWFVLKSKRRSMFKAIPLTDLKNKPFKYAATEDAQRLLHEITQRATGSVGASDQLTNSETRNRYLVRNLMEEGITSSMIEGASTTRQAAKEMLRTKRQPRDEAERMVLNNYTAMQHIVGLDSTELTPEIVLELHDIITRNTLEDSSGAGRLRRSDEEIKVIDPSDNEILHVPPPAGQLPERMEMMCNFANGKTPEGFVHPVVRAILLHFWLAYDHPFKDGNGRCARALFYWSMLRHDYWLCQFFSISKVILRAPKQYARMFLYTETDENDLTYFLLHQLNVVQKAIDELHRYLDSKVAQRREIETRMRLSAEINDRQMDVLAHALRHPDVRYDIRQHVAKYDVVYQTARTDLLDLAEKGLLTKRKIGRAFYFYPSSKLEEIGTS